MSHTETYHRTFLPDGPFESFESAHGRKEKKVQWPDFGPQQPSQFPNFPQNQVTPPKTPAGYQPIKPFPAQNPQPAVNPYPAPTGKPYLRTQGRFRIIQTDGAGSYNEIWVVEKEDQKFNTVATPWEQVNSKLLPGGHTFDPVVNKNLTVVGYVGAVYDNHIYVPSSSKEIIEKFPDLDQNVETFPESHFVAAFQQPGFRQWGTWDPKELWFVATDPDGHITAAEHLGGTSNAESVANPDIRFLLRVLPALLGKLVLVVGTVGGKRLLTRLARRRGMNASTTGGSSGGRRGGGIPGGPGAMGGKAGKLTGTPVHHPKVTGSIGSTDAEAIAREREAMMRYADSGNVKHVWMDDAARPKFGVAAHGEKYPDVTAEFNNGTWGLAEGKGTDVTKMIQQFERAGRVPELTGKIARQEVVVQRLKPLTHPDGGTFQMVGPNFATGVNGA